MTTRATMLAEMADDMERSDTATFGSKISAAIRHYQPKRFWFNESRSVTISTISGTDLYTFTDIGTEFYRLDSVWITIDSDDVRELTRMNYVDLEGLADSNTDTGEPSDYSYIDKAVRLWRSPDDAYDLRLTGHVKVPEPSGDDIADNVWMTEAYDLIMCRAKSELYAHRYSDPSNAAIMRTAEMDALQRLLSATDDKVSTGHLEATQF